MELCISMPQVKSWEQSYVFSNVNKLTKQFTCNWPSPGKLTFKWGYFLPDITNCIIMCLFWSLARIGLLRYVSGVKNWGQRYVFSVSKKSTKQLVCNWSSLCKLTIRRAYFLLNSSTVVSTNGRFFWHPKDLLTNFNFYIVKSPLAFFKNLQNWGYFDEGKEFRKQPIFWRNRLFLV